MTFTYLIFSRNVSNGNGEMDADQSLGPDDIDSVTAIDKKAAAKAKTSEKKAAKTYASEAKKRKNEIVLSPLEKSSILSEKSSLRGEEEERQLDETMEGEDANAKSAIDKKAAAKAKTSEKRNKGGNSIALKSFRQFLKGFSGPFFDPF